MKPVKTATHSLRSLLTALCLGLGLAWGTASAADAPWTSNAVVWDGTRYFIAGSQGIIASTDAAHWKPLRLPTYDPEITTIATNGQTTIAIGFDGIALKIVGDSAIITSPQRAAPVHNLITQLFWSGSEFIGLGQGEGDSLMRSVDGITWTHAPSNIYAGLAGWGNKVVVGDSGVLLFSSYQLYFSKDYSTWTPLITDSTFHGILDGIWTDGHFLITGDQGQMLVSTNGLDWHEDTNLKNAFGTPGVDEKGVPNGITYYNTIYGIAATKNGLLAVDNDGIRLFTDFSSTQTKRIFTDHSNGAFWPRLWSLAGPRIFDLNYLWSTTDGADSLVGEIDFSGPPQAWRDSWTYHNVVWDGTRYLVSGDQGLLTSTDAHLWKPLAIPGPAQPILTLATNGQTTLATGADNTVYRISGDVVTVGPNALGGKGSLQLLAWTGTEFVGFGASGFLTRSVNGTTWTAQATPLKVSATDNLKLIAGDSNFVLIAPDTSYASRDGIQWTPLKFRSPLHDVVWTSEGFVAGGNEGLLTTSKNGFAWQEDSATKTSLLRILGYDDSGRANMFNGNDIFGIARVGNANLILNYDRIASSTNNQNWTDVTNWDISGYWPMRWTAAGSRLFSLGLHRIWSTSNGLDTLRGRFDPAYSTQIASRPTRLAAHLDAHGLHLELDRAQTLRIDLIDLRGRTKLLAHGPFPAGSHAFAVPPTTGCFLRIKSLQGTQILPLGLHK